MADVSPEAVILQEPKEIIATNELPDMVYESFNGWLVNDFRTQLSDLMQQQDLRGDTKKARDIALADLTRKFAIGLWPLGRNISRARKWDRALTEAVFGERPDSVVNTLGPAKKDEVIKKLVGPISVVTFLDMIHKSRPSLLPQLDEGGLKEIITEGEEDVINKIDLILRFGDKNSSGREVVRLIQLKTWSRPDVEIDRLVSEDGYYLEGKIEPKAIEKILDRARNIEEEEGVEVRSYGVMVPAFNSEAVRNVFGIINPNPKNMEAQQLPRRFASRAEKLGLLPDKV